jgi:RIO-like serine/threonine protein kinase
MSRNLVKKAFIKKPKTLYGWKELFNEYVILNKLQHLSFVPKIYNLSYDLGITLECVEGVTLDEYTGDLHQINFKIMKCLYELHKSGYVHGDIHAKNIIIRDDEPILIDFGLACKISERRSLYSGLLRYVPKWFLCQNEAVDYWQLKCTIFEVRHNTKLKSWQEANEKIRA